MIKPLLLVLCVDIDNDLYEKTDITGPVIGKEANIQAGLKLIKQDPEESDANAIFKAIQIAESLEDKYNTKIVTLTGSKNKGFEADKNISEQLERVLAQFPAESCVFVSDGVSDEVVMPIIKSRIKIDSVHVVIIKQAKQLEQTYFVILEKLKDPYYSRMIFGIPAVLLLLFSISGFYNLGWQPIGMILGIYLMLKGFGFEEKFFNFISDFKFSVEKISWIAYVGAVPLLLLNFWIEAQAYNEAISQNLSIIKIGAILMGKAMLLTPWAFFMIIIGKAMDSFREKRKFEIIRYGTYAISILLLFLVISSASDWILNTKPPYVSFADFINVLLFAVFAAYISNMIVKKIKMNVISHMKIQGKEVNSEYGEYIGKVIGVDNQKELMIVQTPFGKKRNISLKEIREISDKISVSV